MDEISYIKWISIMAWQTLGLQRDSIIIEEAYTQEILRFLDKGERQKTNFQIIRWRMITLLKKRKERCFSEVYEWYEPEDTGNERGNNVFTENIIDELIKKYYSENQINEALYYYSTIWSLKKTLSEAEEI